MPSQDTKYVCFSKRCVPVNEIRVRFEDGVPESVSVMKEAASQKGLRLVACDNDRNCSLYVAADATQGHVEQLIKLGCRSRLPSGHWDTSLCWVKGPFTAEGLVYMISPDERVIDIMNKFSPFSYVGKGKDLLIKREQALYELKDRLVGEYGTDLKTSFKFNYYSQDDLKIKCDKRNRLLLKSGFPVDFTPSLSAIAEMPAEAIDRECVIFYSRIDAVEDGFLKMFFSGHEVFVRDHNILAEYDGRYDRIILNASVFSAIVNGERALLGVQGVYNDNVFDSIRHESYHRAWDYSRVRSETESFYQEAFALAKSELQRNGVTEPNIDKYRKEAANRYMVLGAEEILAFRRCRGHVANFLWKEMFHRMWTDLPPLTFSYFVDDLLQRIGDEPWLQAEQKESMIKVCRAIIEHKELIKYNPLKILSRSNPFLYYFHPADLFTEE